MGDEVQRIVDDIEQIRNDVEPLKIEERQKDKITKTLKQNLRNIIRRIIRLTAKI